MCIFAQPVASVSSTNIFGRLDGEGNQFTAYQMEYASSERNAMILPIPTSSGVNEESVTFIDLSDYDSFFEDMDKAFPALIPPPKFSRGAAIDSNVANLAVHKVGNFVASMVPNLTDFSRLDSRFTIAPETWAKIPSYSDYSFVVFQLEELAGKPHPIAFKFPTRHTKQIFFPTVHIHDGEVHAREEFDHVLYCQDGLFDDISDSYSNRPDRSTGWTRSQSEAKRNVDIAKSQGLVAPNLLLHRKKMRGMLENTDVLVPVDAKLLPSLGFKRRFFSPGLGLASAIGVAGISLAWLVNRRAKLMAPQSDSKKNGVKN